LADYRAAYFLGDSMGAAAALRFSSLANDVLAFTPQVDISKYQAITRLDFSLTAKKEFQRELLSVVKNCKAAVTIHYGKDCVEDVRQIRLLPQPLPPNVTLVAHDFDDHILSLHLRDQGKLTEMVEAAIVEFLDTNSLR
jgi:hypothetical protein